MSLCFTPTPLNHPTQTSSQIPIVTKYVQIPNEPSSTYPNKYFSLVQNTNYENIQNHIYYHALKYTLVIVNTQRLQSGYIKPQ